MLFERLGTKALVIDAKTAAIIRETDRSYYCADAYVFPLALWTSPAGRTLLAHCPEAYNRLEIDDVETGRRLTLGAARRPGDYFHSRLAVSPSGLRLLSAGWVWHPWDFVGWFDLDRALTEPDHLDTPQVVERSPHVGLLQEASAAWQTDDLLLIGSSDEREDPDEVASLGDSPRLVSPGLAVVEVRRRAVVRSVSLVHPPGIMMPIGLDAVVTFYDHPRLYRLSDGHLLHEWPDLETGKLIGSIQHHLAAPPALAVDPRRMRFAVAQPDAIAVVDLSSLGSR